MEGTKSKLTSMKCINALNLKLIAMALMLCDHISYSFPQCTNLKWMNYIGRFAFPIFAFQIVEGFFHTHSFKRYWTRVFLFALISEIPFNLMVNGSLLYAYHQNVMFTFCIALPLLAIMDKARKRGRGTFALATVLCVVFGYVLGYLAQVDYFGEGILMVLLFYLFHDVRHGWIGQLLGMLLINLVLLGNQTYHWIDLSAAFCTQAGDQVVRDWLRIGQYMFPFPGFGKYWSWSLPEQAFAVLGLIPIWLYNGKQGMHNRPLQYACYAFYPVHMLILGLLAKFI